MDSRSECSYDSPSVSHCDLVRGTGIDNGGEMDPSYPGVHINPALSDGCDLCESIHHLRPILRFSVLSEKRRRSYANAASK